MMQGVVHSMQSPGVASMVMKLRLYFMIAHCRVERCEIRPINHRIGKSDPTRNRIHEIIHPLVLPLQRIPASDSKAAMSPQERQESDMSQHLR
jgi:hypothetical protein